MARMSESVQMWFDPLCPWAWMTSRWLMEVEKVRDIEVTWSVMSLAALNEGRDLDEGYRSLMDAGWEPVRVVAAARDRAGDDVVKPLYDAMGTRIHLGGLDLRDDAARADMIRESLAEVGLDADLAQAASSTEFDDRLREEQSHVVSLVGDEVGTPVISVGGVAFFGPVVSPAPKGEDAGRLFDGCRLVAGTPGFFELKRSRDVGPIFD